MIDKNKEFSIYDFIDETSANEDDEDNVDENTSDDEDEHFEWWLRYGNR